MTDPPQKRLERHHEKPRIMAHSTYATSLPGEKAPLCTSYALFKPLSKGYSQGLLLAANLAPGILPNMRALLDVVLIILNLYVWLLIAAAILSWLIAFNVVNPYNKFVSNVGEFLYRITEPVLEPVRSILPNLGGLDLSPMAVILIIFFLQRVIYLYIYPNVF